jgi:hypothetical protein
MSKRERESTWTGAPSGTPQAAMAGPPRSSIEAQRKNHLMDELLANRSPVPLIGIPAQLPPRRVYPDPEE